MHDGPREKLRKILTNIGNKIELVDTARTHNCYFLVSYRLHREWYTMENDRARMSDLIMPNIPIALHLMPMHLIESAPHCKTITLLK